MKKVRKWYKAFLDYLYPRRIKFRALFKSMHEIVELNPDLSLRMYYMKPGDVIRVHDKSGKKWRLTPMRKVGRRLVKYE